MINKKNIRDYEVSLWTLQDSFISVLKASNVENRGTIQDPKMIIKDDGENSFSFKIPMYIKEDTNLEKEPYIKKNFLLIENPIWYNVRDGILIANMRKIKVIFNKTTQDEEIFEFIITKITESHEGKTKYCEVESGGLAFHELGKQGYNINLSHDDFLAEYEKWDTNEEKKIEDKPIENIDYWIKKVLQDSNWDYEIQMDWSAFQVDNENEGWDSHKIYNEPYISSWVYQEENESLIPENIVIKKENLEKIKAVESSESNRYNLLQEIAKVFEVFTKYKYYYDDNYHIIGRKVIFYNSYNNDKKEAIDLTYGYNTSQISREIDSMDLVTKMYIKPMKDSGTYLGEIKLSDSLANKTLEEYLLNFDYLYKIGTIAKDQYEEIKKYEKELHKINTTYMRNERLLLGYNNQKDFKKERKDYDQSLIEESEKYLNKASGEYREITSGTNYCIYANTNPLTCILNWPIDDKNNPYIFLSSNIGELDKSSFKIYEERLPNGEVNSAKQILNKIEFVEKNGIVDKIIIKKATKLKEKTTVFATFKYKPDVPSKKIKQLYTSKIMEAKKELEKIDEELPLIEESISSIDKEQQSLIDSKKDLINNFERFMGPSIREGTWNPEDSYSNYQTNEVFTLKKPSLLENENTDLNNSVGFIWDIASLENEIEISYPYGLDTEHPIRYYPCILLNENDLELLKNKNNLNLVYRDYYWDIESGAKREEDYIDPSKNHYLNLNSDDGIQFVFLRDKIHKTIKPALIILGVRNLIDEFEENNSKPTTPFTQVCKNARLSITSYSTEEPYFSEEIIINEESLRNKIISSESISNYEIVYPRFYNSSLNFLTTIPENMIYYGNIPLKENEDYIRTFYVGKSGQLANYLTLKTNSIIFKLNNFYSFHYCLSTAADAIYLDAEKILKESSMPKVSYSLTPLIKNESFIKKAYNSLGQLCHINDIELKFENIQGYISEVNLNLDKPWEDNYIIKNYKTKFEDLFTTIVAQTQSMQRNSQTLAMTSNLFDNNGYINSDLLNKSINVANNLQVFELIAVTEEAMFSQLKEQIYKVTSEAALILNGDIGLAFPATDTIDGISLNNEVGLRIDGTMKRVLRDENGEPKLIDGSYCYDDENTIKSYFRVTNGAMGFFKKGSENEKDEGMMYFDALTGDMALKGTLWAKAGGFGVVLDENDKPSNGWLIETGTFKSLNNRAVFTSGGKQGNPTITLYNVQNQPIFEFVEGNLNITGVITATKGGNIAGWIIGENALYKEDDNNAVVGMSPGTNNISFWAGGSASSAPFRVTSGGALTATNANITGEIKATSGAIGQDKAPKINIGSSGNTSTSSSWIYSGSKKSKNSANEGFYIGTDGISLGVYENGHNPFEVNTAGNLYAKGVEIEGTIHATGGTIGNWDIGTDTIQSESVKDGKTYITGLQRQGSGRTAITVGAPTNSDWSKAPFYILHDGTLHATSANIKGEIEATSGSFTGVVTVNGGCFTTNSSRTSYNSNVNGVTISSGGIGGRNGNSYFTLDTDGKITANNVDIKGEIEATSGSFKGKIEATSGSFTGTVTVNDTGCFTTNSERISYNGLQNGVTISSGGIGGRKGDSFFKLDTNGKITANDVEITGGSFSISTKNTKYDSAIVAINSKQTLKIEGVNSEVFMPFYIKQSATKFYFWEESLELITEQGKDQKGIIMASDSFSLYHYNKDREIDDGVEISINEIDIKYSVNKIQFICGPSTSGIRDVNTNKWLIRIDNESHDIYIGKYKITGTATINNVKVLTVEENKPST